MMFSRAQMRALRKQPCDHHERTEVPIHDGDVSRTEAREHRTQQRRFTSLFASIGTDREVRPQAVANDTIATARAMGSPTPAV